MLESVPRGFHASMLILQRNTFMTTVDSTYNELAYARRQRRFKMSDVLLHKPSEGPRRCWHLPGYAYIHRANVDQFWPRLAPTTYTYDSNWNSRAATSLFPHPESYGTSRPPLPYDAMAPLVPLWVLYKKREKSLTQWSEGCVFSAAETLAIISCYRL